MKGMVKMKGKKVLLYLIMCIGLVSCSKNEQEGYGENYNRKYDSQNFSANREQTVTEDGFYTIQEEYIFFVDKKSGKAIPLCGKVNCKHNDSTCNAYFNAPLNIQAYDGKIYVVARGSKDRTESLYRISLDGSKKEELKVLYANEDNDVSCALEFMIHRGYGYMVTNWVQKDRTERTQSMYRISLDTSEKKEEIASITGYVPLIYINESRGNKIYFSTNRYIDQDGKKLEVINYELDILKDSIRKLDFFKDKTLIVAKDERYYCYQKGGKGLLSFDKDGGDEKNIFEWKYDETMIYHDEKYLYFDNMVYLYLHDLPDTKRRIVIVDYDGNKVCEWKKFGTKNLAILWSDSEQLLLRNNEKETYQIVKMADLSKLE